ncbi:hypothetical protein BGZ60DRAFT_498422 [Tricladium varicosporioides]|nr:hypothetical protein BGZ60DRAFT_498422 [Hymenoscyphus varicosporioides]
MSSDPSYNRVDPFSPLGTSGGLYQSPAQYSRTWGQYHGDLGSPEIEMRERMEENPRQRGPVPQQSQTSMHSVSSTLFGAGEQNNTETQSFLHGPLNKIDTIYAAHHYPYKDHTGRQLRHILFTSLGRWVVTLLLCAGYIGAVLYYRGRGAQDEMHKKVFNTITTGISISMGLNIASAFKDMSLNMRWPILHMRKRSLEEVDHFLHADSLLKLSHLALMSRTPLVILGALSWLFINILAQAGIAMLSLTYSWDAATDGVLFHNGNVSIADMAHFYPTTLSFKGSTQDEEYTAHLYGSLANNYIVNTTQYKPKAGDIYQNSGASIFVDDPARTVQFLFSDSPTGAYQVGTGSVYTDRTINVTWGCSSYKVTSNGSGNVTSLQVANIGTVNVSTTVVDSTTYFTTRPATTAVSWSRNYCGSNKRCSVVEVFEANSTDPWYYKCNITVGKTYNDPKNVSYISDEMAWIAGSSIAQVGYIIREQEAQVYPRGSDWGKIARGDANSVGKIIATFASGSIAGAELFNPQTSYLGPAPSQGMYLKVGHKYFFFVIIGLICGCHLLFCIIVAILANRVKVGPSSHLDMALLLRPIADALEGVSDGKTDSQVYKDAKKTTTAIYKKGTNGRWNLEMK